MEAIVAKGTSRSEQRNNEVMSLSKRRGFVYPSSEIYGGTRSAWDYGPLGVELKENVRRQWWRAMVQRRDDVVGLDSAVILAREVWVASGHVDTFTDPLSECQSCHKRFRADHLEEAYEAKKGTPPPNGLADVNCPNCGVKGAFTEPRQFSGLLKTYLGPVESDEGLHYLRPETAQGIFVNFLNVMTSARKKPPFGIAQTGKSFRNEITPGNFIFRTHEFEQMEMEFFVVGTRLDEELHLHLLELAGSEDEVSRRDLVAERLADLTDTKRGLLPAGRDDVGEVDKNALGGLWTKIVQPRIVIHRTEIGLEHHVEVAWLGPLSTGAAIGTRDLSQACWLAPFAPLELFLELIGPKSLVTGQAFGQRVMERGEMP